MLAYVVAAREVRCSSVHAKCLLQYYASNTNKHGKFFKSTHDICAETMLSESFVRKTNAVWEAMKLLTITEHKRSTGLANDYAFDLRRLKLAADQSTPAKEEAKDRAKRMAAERQRRHRDKQNVTPSQSVTHDSVTPSHGVCHASA